MAITLHGGSFLFSAGVGAQSIALTGAFQPQAGDRLLIVHGNDYYAFSNLLTPTVGVSSTGVTAITGGSADAGSLNAHVKSYYFDVSATGDVTVAAVESGAADEEKIIAVAVLAGHDPATAPVAANLEDHSFTLTTVRLCNGVTPTGSDDLLFVFTNDGGGSSSSPYTPPGGMTEQYDTNSGGGMGASAAIEQLASSAPTGTRSFGVAGSISSYVTLTIAVKAAASSITAVGQQSTNRHPGRGPGRARFYQAPRSTDTAVAQASSGVATASAHPSTAAGGARGASGSAAGGSRVSTVATGIKNASGAAAPSTHPTTSDTGRKNATGTSLVSVHPSSQVSGTKNATGTGLSSAHPSSAAASGAPAPTGVASSSARVSTIATGIKNVSGAAAPAVRPATRGAGIKAATGAAAPAVRPATRGAGLKAAAGTARVSAHPSTLGTARKGAIGAGLVIAHNATQAGVPAPTTPPAFDWSIGQGGPAWRIAQTDPAWPIGQAGPAWKISQG